MNHIVNPPSASYKLERLPLTTLHYVTCGEGSPLIMLPATMSKIKNWLPLAQFMAQKFKVFFFELPGHGKSTPFKMSYSSDQVAESMGDFIDNLGYSSVGLFGFSFGGILTLQMLNHLQEKIDKVILISPCVSKNTVLLTGSRKRALHQFLAFLKIPLVQKCFVHFLHHERYGFVCAGVIRRLGKVENTIALEEILCWLPTATVDALIYQANEILNYEIPPRKSPYPQKCYFAMSINDPVLDFGMTLDILDGHFEDILIKRFRFPYHQPPVLPTFEELNLHYGPFLDLIL